MNALELADELENRYKYAEASECMLDAATMLRQKQAEIEAAYNKGFVDGQRYAEKYFKAEIEALKKANEELAEYKWMYEGL